MLDLTPAEEECVLCIEECRTPATPGVPGALKFVDERRSSNGNLFKTCLSGKRSAGILTIPTGGNDSPAPPNVA